MRHSLAIDKEVQPVSTLWRTNLVRTWMRNDLNDAPALLPRCRC